jgi:hypothetical protein
VVLQIQVQKFFFFFSVNRFENSPSFLSMWAQAETSSWWLIFSMLHRTQKLLL